jgi:hypothetical protein
VTRLLYLPLIVLSAAFLILCMRHGTAWPWNVIVHEDGRRTLLDTILYFDHALGELPLDVLLGAAVAGSMLRSGRTNRLLVVSAVTCLAIDGAIIAGAWIQSGAKLAAQYLLQFHTRDDAPMIFGSHWRYHLLSQVALMLLPLAFASAVGRAQAIAWIVFAALTIVFGVSRSSFIDPRYLGHQARELFTHTLVTIPLALALVGQTARSAAGSHAGWAFNRKPAIAFLAVAIYLAAGVVLTGSHQHAQSSDWTAVICAHFFEHTFSYLAVPAHALLFYQLGARPQ